MHWDRLQRESLQAMGLSPYRVLPGPDAPAEISPTLRAALARAAHVSEQALPPISVAMAVESAAGKRALWPRLRALRRER